MAPSNRGSRYKNGKISAARSIAGGAWPTDGRNPYQVGDDAQKWRRIANNGQISHPKSHNAVRGAMALMPPPDGRRPRAAPVTRFETNTTNARDAAASRAVNSASRFSAKMRLPKQASGQCKPVQHVAESALRTSDRRGARRRNLEVAFRATAALRRWFTGTRFQHAFLLQPIQCRVE